MGSNFSNSFVYKITLKERFTGKYSYQIQFLGNQKSLIYAPVTDLRQCCKLAIILLSNDGEGICKQIYYSLIGSTYVHINMYKMYI